MDRNQLTELNIGQNLDDLMNLDPRGYGVCRILYDAARSYTKEPLTMNGAKRLIEKVQEGDLVYIITGFVLLPHKKAEMDGIVSSILLARALVKAFHAKPVFICPIDCKKALKNLAATVGLHCYDTIEEVIKYPISMAVIPFTKEKELAIAQGEELISYGLPSAVISIEHPGGNEYGVYHNAVGLDVTDLESKADLLFMMLKDRGVLNIAIGDLGNELGMGTLKDKISKYIPYTGENGCDCGCTGGIMAASQADHIITATTSDWGCYGLIAAIAFLKKDMDIIQSSELEKEVIITASRSGMIDMYGWLIPSVDGMDLKMNVLIVELMRKCIDYPMKLEKTCATWFDKVIEKGYFSSRGVVSWRKLDS